MMQRSLLIVLISFAAASLSLAQNNDNHLLAVPDTVMEPPVELSPEAAIQYLSRLLEKDELWKDKQDSLRFSLTQILLHARDPYDSVRTRLENFPFSSLGFRHEMVVRHDTLPLRWLEEGVFYVDTIGLEKDPYVQTKTVVLRALADSLAFPAGQNYLEMRSLIDSVLQVRDTIVETRVDYDYLQARNVALHRVENGNIIPPLHPPAGFEGIRMLPDSTHLLLYDTTHILLADEASPFQELPDSRLPDSLHVAVNTLLDHTYERDSILIQLHDLNGGKTPFWLTPGEDDLLRYWVRNSENDSITVWIGNPGKYDLTLSLEDEVFVERLEKKVADDIPITTITPQRTLAKVQPLAEIPTYWDLGLNTSFSLNQNYLSNWARGGDNSFSGILDIRASARYNNKDSGSNWTSSSRLRYGTVRTQEHGSRTSTDIIEFNSQYNKQSWEKVSLSSVLYMKTQVAEGFRYPNDSVPISRFLNPGAFTLGVGLEYEPIKDTKLNFSVLSYRNTFVLDTLNINQTTHGIETGKRSRQEMGGQLVFNNSMEVFDGLKVANKIRLFSNYLDKPQNVDVDWEMSLEQQIAWYFTVRLNLHLIYDDDIRFAVLDSAGDPVLLPDGNPKKVAKPQFNQFLGITLSLQL